MAELVECARLEIVYTGDRIEGSNPPISARNLPAQSGGLIYGGIGRFRNISRTKFGGWVRKQVDFGSDNAPKSSRFPRSVGFADRGNPPISAQGKNMQKRICLIEFLRLCFVFVYQGGGK